MPLRKLEVFLQTLRRRLGIPRAPDDLDHLVDVVDGDLETLEDVRPLIGLPQIEGRPAHDHHVTMIDEVLEHLPERKNAGYPVHQRQHDRAESRLHLCVLVQPIQDDLWNGVPLELDDDAEPVSVGFVPHVTDFGDLLVPNQLSDLLDQAGFVDHERDLRHDDALGGLIHFFDLGTRSHYDPASAGPEGVFDARPSTDEPTRRKIGASHQLLEPLLRKVGIGNQGRRRREDLPQVMWRDVGRHSYSDPRTAVDEQVRHPRRKDRGLFQAPVEVGREGNRLLLDVLPKLHRQCGKAGFGVPVCRRRVAIDGPEISLAVDEGITQRELLDHPHHGVVHGGIAMGVVLAQHIPDHRGRLLVTPPRAQPELAHRVQDAPVNRLQAVTYVGQRSLYNDAHRVVDERFAHLVFEKTF